MASQSLLNTQFRKACSNWDFDPEELKELLPKVESEFIERELNLACSVGHLEFVKFILEIAYIRRSWSGWHGLLNAISKGHLEIMKFLLEDPRVVADDHHFFKACEKGRTEMVNYFLKNTNLDPSTRSNRCIIEAAYQGHLEIVKLLLQDLHVDPSDQDNKALNETSRSASGENHHAKIMELLLLDRRVIVKLGKGKIFLLGSNKILEKIAHYWLAPEPTLAKYFRGLVPDKLIDKYAAHCMDEFDMF